MNTSLEQKVFFQFLWTCIHAGFTVHYGIINKCLIVKQVIALKSVCGEFCVLCNS